MYTRLCGVEKMVQFSLSRNRVSLIIKSICMIWRNRFEINESLAFDYAANTFCCITFGIHFWSFIDREPESTRLRR